MIGRVVAARIASSAPLAAMTASARESSAVRAASAVSTSTTTEMPSPSEIAWLSLRAFNSDADRVPDRLQLEEVRDLVRALAVGPPAHNALYVLGSEPLELRQVAVGAADVERIHVHVPRQPRCELRAVAGDDVDNAAGNVRGRDRLGQ